MMENHEVELEILLHKYGLHKLQYFTIVNDNDSTRW